MESPTETDGRMVRVHVLVTLDIDEKMREIAEAQDRPLTRVYRQAVHEYLANKEDE